MSFFENIKIALQSIFANKMRSLLTMLGIIIGISAVITITTIGNSIKQTLSHSINELGGANYLNMEVTTKPEITDEELELGIPEMTDDDKISEAMIEELQDKYPGNYTTVRNEFLGMGTVINRDRDELRSYVMGCSDGYLSSFKIKYLAGRDISVEDMRAAKSVCTVSDLFVRQYFKKGEDPLHKTIRINIRDGSFFDFTIVGVYKHDIKVLGSPPDPSTPLKDQLTLIAIPIDTVYKLQGKDEQFYSYFSVQWNPDLDKDFAKNQLQSFLDEKYKSNKYYHAVVDTQDMDILESFNMVINIVTIAITVIGGISLIVGGVGVMNIMLVSVTERTREIGIRKAIGAKVSVIKTQFVIESIILCVIGGIIGIIIGIVNGILIGRLAVYLMNTLATEYAGLISVSIQPSVWAIVLSVLFSMLTGVFFGYYPAKKAADMNAIDALRYE